jgi:hypothetical protein
MAHNLGIRPLRPSVMAALRTRYDGAVRHVDAMTSALFDRLRDAGILDGAVVAVTSDHGEHLGEQGRLDHRMTLHDAVLHVPLVVRWPGRLEGGAVVRTPVSLADLHPTLCEAAGIEPPPGTALDAVALSANPAPRPLFAFHAAGLDHLPQLRSTFPPDVPDSAFDRVRISLRAARSAAADGSGVKYLEETRHDEGGGVGEPVRRLVAPGDEDVPPLAGDDAPERLRAAGALRSLLDDAERRPSTPRGASTSPR